MVNWYAVHVLSGRESKTKDLLLNRAIKMNFWKNSIMEILIPTEKEYVTRNGKRKIIDKKIFPGYLFINMDLDKESEQLVQSTDGITGFVRIGTKPIPVEDYEIKRILKNINSVEDAPKSSYKNNDVVLIVAGPFADFTGKVDHIDDARGKIKCLVQIFGRDTSVELDMNQVELCK
jgi:transcriptional antiterminator NusG